jgi:isocitrate/isopropylmalate dehydrogenase
MVGWVGKGELDGVVAKFMEAVENVTSNTKTRTKDLGGSANTQEVTDAVCKEIEKVFGKK